MKNGAKSEWGIQQSHQDVSEEPTREGCQTAMKEGEAAFESIEIRHSAEIKAAEVDVKHIKAIGHTTLQHRETVQVQIPGCCLQLAWGRPQDAMDWGAEESGGDHAE